MTEQGDPLVVVDEQGGDRGPRVVVGVDFSTGARAALLFALQDATRRGVPVEAVTAYRPPDYWMDFYAVASYQPDQIRTAALDRLRSFVTEVLPEGPQPPPVVRLHASMGVAADALILESHGADLLVVGSRGHGGFASMLLGSVSMQVAQHASCPVTVVHSPEAHRERLHLRRGRQSAGTPVG
ncbi:universal stress protein [Blastococcus sp. CT_GayMR20]|uniref:universal stress protein n=1 Tax=Blastococcus sp. CT_GayMR20 TaxID=2559609 RepID=UPI001072ED76|nr:universal stress protein [Blastococcus sp. CT_GayMR20]TFV92943.1 universal stress protein [Blastococcus sp. CT_GayMR20]